jgi:hypothetical protein
MGNIMDTATSHTEVTLSASELLRLKRWFQNYSSDPHVQLEPSDLVLDAKLRALRYDMQDRDSARVFAIRAATAKQYVGPERRTRIVAAARQRMVRAAVKQTVCN